METKLDVLNFVAAVTDFEDEDVYAYLYNLQDDPFLQSVCHERLKEKAVSLGFKTFDRRYKSWIAGKKSTQQAEQIDDVPDWMDTAGWKITGSGITKETDKGKLEACAIPIFPVQRLISIDSDEEKLKLRYKANGTWREYIVDNSVLSSNAKVVSLFSVGIPITSYNASTFVRYIHDIYGRNMDTMPIANCFTRCGYHDKFGFAPFSEMAVFCGDSAYKSMYNAIASCGSEDESIRTITTVCRDSTQARLSIAASLASVLIKPLGKLPFIVHNWSIDSGTGKSVLNMACASLWANPEIGVYIKTFDSTAVGHERILDFLNNLPFIVDELQLAKDKYGSFKVDPYKLTEGTGRSRSNVGGGIDRPTMWRNSIISCGESPITNESTNAGAVNRIIEMQCESGCVLVNDGIAVADALRKNYGFIGKKFLDYISDVGIDFILDKDRKLTRRLSELTTEKQAASFSCIILADMWMCENVTGLDHLRLDDFRQYMVTKERVSTGASAIEYITQWIASNRERFYDDCKQTIYGKREKMDDGKCEYTILSTVFKAALDSAGFNSTASIEYMDRCGFIVRKEKGRIACRARVGGVQARCYKIILEDDDD